MGAEARFNGPQGIAVDCAGRVYVSDYCNRTLRRVNATGHVTTVAGTAGQGGSVDGWGAAARVRPLGLAVCADGSLYMVGNHVVRRVR